MPQVTSMIISLIHCVIYRKGTSIRQAPVFRHLRALSGWMNYNYTACCWFPTSNNILILPSQFWQISFESYWLHCSKCRILVLLRYLIIEQAIIVLVLNPSNNVLKVHIYKPVLHIHWCLMKWPVIHQCNLLNIKHCLSGKTATKHILKESWIKRDLITLCEFYVVVTKSICWLKP